MIRYPENTKVYITSDFVTSGKSFRKGDAYVLTGYRSGWAVLTNFEREYAISVPAHLIANYTNYNKYFSSL